jgi:hypothetical protein
MPREPEFDVDVNIYDHKDDEVRIEIIDHGNKKDVDFCLSGEDAEKFAIKLLGHAKRAQKHGTT